MDDEAANDVATQFALFARYCERDGAPLYQRLSAGAAQDPAMVELLVGAPPAQRRPLLLLAAVHDLLLAGEDDPLAAHYPTVGPTASPAPPSGDPYADFARFCDRHRAQLAEALATRSTQTNEVGRCTGLVPALAEVARRAGQPLSILDLGSSAGLHLLFDRYAYTYRHGDSAVHAGQERSPVHLEAEVRHGQPSAAIPAVDYRAGLDLDPVDLDDPQRARWLLACQWPDHADRFFRTAQAIEVARATADRPQVHRGDMVSDLAQAAAAVPPDSRLCVTHTWVAAYLSPEDQGRLTAAVGALAEERPVSWLFAEQPFEVPGLQVPEASGPGANGAATAVVLVELDGHRRRAERLADMHPHGRWLRWWAGPT